MGGIYKSRIESPCLNCTDRELGCHGTCAKYKEYSVKKETFKSDVRNAKMQHYEHMNFISQQRERHRKSHR